MTYLTGTNVSQRGEIAPKISAFGSGLLRYGLVLVIGWIGLMKFTGYEANGIEPLVAHSPLLGWIGCITYFQCGSFPPDWELLRLPSRS